MNLFKAITIPRGIAIKEAIETAKIETFNDVITTLKSKESKLNM